MDNDLIFPYPSRRSVVYANKGMVATSQHLAAHAGLDILKKGGNAVDAAVAAAMALTVLEPCSNGIGGDAFCIAWINGKMYGLNSSGPAPQTISLEKVKAHGHNEMPKYGVIPVTVPGIPAAWAALCNRFGKLPLTTLAEPAVNYAEDGFPLSPTVASAWAAAAGIYGRLGEKNLYKPWFDTFVPGGEIPVTGSTWRSRDHAKTLRAIAESGAGEFYNGYLADKIDLFFRENGGFLTKEDLAGFKPEWVEPVSVKYRGYDVWELPPNGQGLVALMALKILDKMQSFGREQPIDFHNRIEAVKLAFTDGFRHITDPAEMDISVDELLSEALAEKRRRLICGEAIAPEAVPKTDHGTVYLCTADSEGNMVSYIQSCYMGFGSGVVIPGTGISMQNRGANFSLHEGHANCLKPGKRTYHTIIPAFLTKNGEAAGPFGVMGGFMQPQGHVQVVSNLLDYGLNQQAALDAPRWQWTAGKNILAERGIPDHIVAALKQMGHGIEYNSASSLFGRGQIILKNPRGGLIGATEPRADGTVAAW